MSDISTIIDVYKMDDLSVETRTKLIIKLGQAINATNGMNITEGLVYEIVKILDDKHPLLEDEHYLMFVKE